MLRWQKMLGSGVLIGGVAIAAQGCVVDHHDHYYPADTEIELEEVTNLGYTCGGPLTSWTVTARETGDTGTAGCEQPVIFTNLAPNATYTFDIQGYAGQRLCWQGACAVVASGGITTFADCSRAIDSLCGF